MKQQHIKLLILCASMILVGNAFAKVTGNCSSCHTMHNSQSGSVVHCDNLHESLLNDDCLGCHTGTNNGSNSTPYVHSIQSLNDGGAEYGESGIEAATLAGGTFKYVATEDSYGHNVVGLGNTDDTLFIPPGYAVGMAAADGSTPGNGSWTTQQITCAGTYGCHGSHTPTSNAVAIRGAHHQGVTGGSIVPGSDTSPAAGYRMLVGIAGYEDSDWEYQPTATAHNQYKGSDGTLDTSTISYLCAQCHGVFHDGSNGSPWLRHPSDFSMSQTAFDSEYRNYGGSGNPYLPATPLASATVTTVIENITFGTSDIVTCLSCHRAHGSPYYKSMRWAYAESSDGGLCNNCHTSKN